MEVVVGSYDEVLLGYRVTKIDEGYQFEQSFTDHSHTGCVKSLAISDKGILASGSTDESIRLFNLKKRSELGSLVHHSGSVTCLEFYKGKHMFSASEDGTVCIWKSFTWDCLKTLRGHKSAVYCLAVHPSGKLALSVGKDKTLRTWNLVSGKAAYVTNIKQVAEIVLWSPDGESYVVVYSNKIDVYKVETAAVYCTIQTERRINSVQFLNDRVLMYGGDGGIVYFHDIKEDQSIHSTDTETVRIRGVTVRKSGEDGSYLMITASSDGFIKLWKVTLSQQSVSTSLLAQHNTGFRLTCLAVRNEVTRPEINTETVKSDATVAKKSKQNKDKTKSSDTNDRGGKHTDSKTSHRKSDKTSSQSGNVDSDSDDDSDMSNEGSDMSNEGSDLSDESVDSDSDSEYNSEQEMESGKTRPNKDKKTSQNIAVKDASTGKIKNKRRLKQQTKGFKKLKTGSNI